MSKFKIEINRDTELVKFKTLQNGEVFICENEEHIKVDCFLSQINAVRLSDGLAEGIDDNKLVTYVKKAKLELII